MSKSGQLIECINPEHLYLGSIHYKQAECMSTLIEQFCSAVEVAMKQRKMLGETYGEIAAQKAWENVALSYPVSLDSDESWQASEALLKR